MRIGLIDVDNHRIRNYRAKPFPNLALCKIAAYHRGKGDTVEWASQMEHYDIIYKAKVFTFTPDDTNVYHADKIITGGTGYDIASKLPLYIDLQRPDYTIYPSVPNDAAYGFLTRGCPNQCPWCVVPRKEGRIRPYMDVTQIADKQRRKLILMDNNILAAGLFAYLQLDTIIARGYQVDFNQGLDARLVDLTTARQLAHIRWLNQTIRFGCDTQAQIAACEQAIQWLQRFGYHGQVMLYTIITDNFEESYSRINYWRQQHKAYDGIQITTHAQPMRSFDRLSKPKQWQADLARWSNHHALCNIPFAEYEPRKGFRCSRYLEEGGQP